VLAYKSIRAGECCPRPGKVENPDIGSKQYFVYTGHTVCTAMIQ
jgi:hypothetical protein